MTPIGGSGGYSSIESAKYDRDISGTGGGYRSGRVSGNGHYDDGKPGKGGGQANPKGKGPSLRIRIRPLNGETPRDVLRKPFRFPAVLGEEFRVTTEAMFEDFRTIGGGEHSQAAPGGRRGRSLERFDAETLTMTWNPRWMTYPDEKSADVRRKLYRIAETRKPVHVLAVLGPGHRGAPLFSGAATVRLVERRLTHGEPDTRYYSLSFVEWRPLDPRRRRKGKGGKKHRRYDFPRKHKLRENDTLRRLAQHYYGDGPKGWQRIRTANGLDRIGSEDKIVRASKRYKVGDRIKIPNPPPIVSGDGEVSGLRQTQDG